jgi:peptide-methionine (S)-S-oxide reductase
LIDWYHLAYSGDHTEAIQIEYDPTQTDYRALLDVFWREHDPTSKHKAQYKSAIYYENEEQKSLADSTMADRQKELRQPIVTDIEKLGEFYDAEE